MLLATLQEISNKLILNSYFLTLVSINYLTYVTKANFPEVSSKLTDFKAPSSTAKNSKSVISIGFLLYKLATCTKVDTIFLFFIFYITATTYLPVASLKKSMLHISMEMDFHLTSFLEGNSYKANFVGVLAISEGSNSLSPA